VQQAEVLPERAADIRQEQAEVQVVPPERVLEQAELPVRARVVLQVPAEQQVLLPEHLQAFRTSYKTFPDRLPVNRNWNRTYINLTYHK
jgi:hypothetical protein